MRASLNFRRGGWAGAVLLGCMFAVDTASAGVVVCPEPTGSFTRTYQTSGAIDCVHGGTDNTTNIGQGGGNDAFLNGSGTNDSAYGNAGPQFGKTWTMIDSEDYVSTGWGLTGLTISNYDADSFDWSLTDTMYDYYALGLKDGGSPKWAVFLLDSTLGSAAITSSRGSWSHVVLYGSGEKDGGGGSNEVPEPGSLALVGLALLGAFAMRRRKL